MVQGTVALSSFFFLNSRSFSTLNLCAGDLNLQIVGRLLQLETYLLSEEDLLDEVGHL